MTTGKSPKARSLSPLMCTKRVRANYLGELLQAKVMIVKNTAHGGASGMLAS